MGRVILVSNRLPVTIEGGSSGQRVNRSSGGLVSGLDPLHQQGDGLWIGYPGASPDISTRVLLKEMRLEPGDIPASDYAGCYDGLSDSSNLPSFHVVR